MIIASFVIILNVWHAKQAILLIIMTKAYVGNVMLVIAQVVFMEAKSVTFVKIIFIIVPSVIIINKY